MLAGGGSAPFELQAPMIRKHEARGSRQKAVDQITTVGSDIAIAATTNNVGLHVCRYGGGDREKSDGRPTNLPLLGALMNTSLLENGKRQGRSRTEHTVDT